MTAPGIERLRFLLRVVAREAAHLQLTDRRLFGAGLSRARLASLEQEPELAERVEAFVSRLCRLQDTLGDKLLPAVLAMSGEAPRSKTSIAPRSSAGSNPQTSGSHFASCAIR